MKGKLTMNWQKTKLLVQNKNNILTFTLIVLIFLTYNLKQVKAVTQTTLSGSCGILANFNYNGWDNKASNQQPNQMTKSAIGTINFDTGRMYVDLSIISNYGDTGTISETVSKVSGTAVLNSFDSDTGIYKYTTTLDSGLSIDFSILPVNSGNTFLISGQIPTLGITNGPPVSGICQKV
jgi:hypothetical protein